MAVDDQPLPRQAERTWTSTLYDPADPRRRLPARARGVHRRPVLVAGRQQHDHQPAARQHRLRLRLPAEPRRLRGPDLAHPLQFGLKLRPRLRRRPAQHALRRRRSASSSRRSSASCRHRAAVAELDPAQARHRLCRVLPQHPAASAAAVLVQGGALGAAGPAPEPVASSASAFLSNRGLVITKPIVEPGAGPVFLAVLAVAAIVPLSCSPLGRSAPDGDRPAIPGAVATCALAS